MLTPSLISDSLGIPQKRADFWLPHLQRATAFAEITSALRLAHWLAQIGHESGRLRHVREIWGPSAAQVRYERDPASAWPTSPQHARSPDCRRNRLAWALGNTRAGDGRRYMGRGLIQVTGRSNHRALTRRLRAALGEQLVPDFEAAPRLLEDPSWAAMSAADYWRARGLNRWADTDDLVTLTRRINGGTNGLADRQAIYAAARAAIARQEA